MKKSLRFYLTRLLLSAFLVLLLGLLAAWWLLRGSLPLLDGAHELAGLSQQVPITRDAQGVPSIEARTPFDAVRALGFLHAQDRFFQMDAARRSAGGELSVWLGKTTIERDKRTRMFNFKDRAQTAFRQLPEHDKACLEAYTAGVNAGLAALDQPPFEYLLLRQTPDLWQPTDSLLVGFAMFMDLQDEFAVRDRDQGLAFAHLPEAVYRFLAANGSVHEAPLIGSPLPVLGIPAPEHWGYLKPTDAGTANARRHSPSPAPKPPVSGGSNAFAIGGSFTPPDHGAMLASDMHLRLNLPHVWYRASVSYPLTEGGEDRLVSLHGVTLPGLPIFVAASNGHLAWGMTVSYTDTQDLIALKLHPEDPSRYFANGEWLSFRSRREMIEVRQAKPSQELYLETIWGPVTERDAQGQPRYALRWAALQNWSLNLAFRQMETARTLEEMLALAPDCGVPSLNIIAAARDGRIAWSLFGKMPWRQHPSPQAPNDFLSDARPLAPENALPWPEAPLPAARFPSILGAPNDFLVSANQRKADPVLYPWLGDAGWDADGRARQIRQAIEQTLTERNSPLTEKDLLHFQLDIRAPFYARWRTILLQALEDDAIPGQPLHPRLRQARQHLLSWDGLASAESLAFRLLRDFYTDYYERLARRLMAACFAAEAAFNPWHLRAEEAFAQLALNQPDAAAPDLPGGWNEEIRLSLSSVLEHIEQEGGSWENRTWGQSNRLRMQHPFSRLIPVLAPFLDMSADPQHGDTRVPRVAANQFGASMRLIVSPGNEEKGILHLPGGISGHPLSPFYRAGHDDWLEGRATPLLPGATVHTLILNPASP